MPNLPSGNGSSMVRSLQLRVLAGLQLARLITCTGRHSR